MTNRFYQAFDSETLALARKTDYRNAFQIDRDRIIHAHAFRKLQSKTQVFLSDDQPLLHGVRGRGSRCRTPCRSGWSSGNRFDTNRSVRTMQTLMRFPTRFFLLGALLAPLPARSAESALITAGDLLKLKQIESPALSPDGRWVIYAVRSIESKPDAKDDWIYQTHLWLAATDGTTSPRQLTFGAASDSAPAWNPAGDRIAFVRAVEKEKPQLRLLPLAGGEAQ